MIPKPELDGEFMLPFLIRLIGFAWKLVKLLLKAGWYLGVYWAAIIPLPDIVFETVAGVGVNAPPILYAVDKCMIVLACILAALTAVQNTVRLIKKDRSFNIFKTIFHFKDNKEKGFVATMRGESVALKPISGLCGVVFGKQKGKYVLMPEYADGHILVIGGAGSGKTSSIAIPTLMSWKERVFAIDIKGELYEKTKARRNEAQIKIFNPTDPNAYGYDPFYMMKLTDDISSETRALALSICPLVAEVKDPFWIKSAQNMLTGFLVYFFMLELDFAESMKVIKSKAVRYLVAEIMESGNEKAISEISQFDGMDDKTLSGVFAELSNHITIFATNDDLQRALSGIGDKITPQDLENGYDIYCCIPEYKLEQWKDLLGMMCNQFLKSFERRTSDNRKPVLFLIDEFARLGKIETISNGLATLRDKKIHIALIVQSRSQINALYGKDVAEGITDNCAYKAILKAYEPNTQEWCSKLVGTYDRTKISSNFNADMVGVGKGQGTSTTTEEKRIIKPEEFAYLQDVVCVFPNGYKRVEKIKYWEDKAFSQ